MGWKCSLWCSALLTDPSDNVEKATTINPRHFMVSPFFFNLLGLVTTVLYLQFSTLHAYVMWTQHGLWVEVSQE